MLRTRRRVILAWRVPIIGLLVGIWLLSNAMPAAAQAPPGPYRFQGGAGPEAEIWAIAPAADGSVWLGTGAGLWRYGDGQWTQVEPTDENGLSGENVLSILQDRDGVWWFGTWGGGIARFDGTDWLPPLTDAGSGLPSNFVRALAQDANGGIWVGTNKGLAHLSGETWTVYDAAGGHLADDDVRSLLVDRAGNLWVGMNDGGAARFDGAAWQAFGPPQLGGSQVNAIYQDATGAVWFATWPIGGTGGVTRYAPHISGGEWMTFNASSGLASNGVHAVFQSADGTYWFGTTGGISRWDEQSWHTYGPDDGLLSTTALSIAQDAGGVMWLGTDKGIFRYTPRQSPLNVNLLLNDGLADASAKGTLNASETAAFALQADGATGPLLVRYRLVGLDDLWRATTQSAIKFGTLPPGRYRFEAQARDADFNYSAPVRFELTVAAAGRPPNLLGQFALSPALTTIGTFLLFLLILSLPVAGLVWHTRGQQAKRALARQFNPYIAGPPIVRHDLFFGRDAVMQEIVGLLHSNSVMLRSEPRMGQSTILEQLLIHLPTVKDAELEFAPVYMHLQGASQDTFLYNLMEEIEIACKRYLQQMPALIIARRDAWFYGCPEFAADLEALLTTLRRSVRSEVRLVLLLDGAGAVCHYDPYFQEELRRLLMQFFARNVSAVVAGLSPEHQGNIAWHALFNPLELARLSVRDATRLITEPVRGIYEWESTAVVYIIERSSGHPYEIQKLCRDAVGVMLAHGRTKVTLADVRDAHAETQEQADRLSRALPAIS